MNCEVLKPDRADYGPCTCDEMEDMDECAGCQEYGVVLAEYEVALGLWNERVAAESDEPTDEEPPFSMDDIPDTEPPF